MNEIDKQIAMAERALAAGQHLLAGKFTEAAGREAYLAAFHAALAYIEHHTGKQPKTHSGTHSEFARVSRAAGSLSPELVAFLGRSYYLKQVSDYVAGPPVSQTEAETALRTATQLLERVVTILSALSPPAGSVS